MSILDTNKKGFYTCPVCKKDTISLTLVTFNIGAKNYVTVVGANCEQKITGYIKRYMRKSITKQLNEKIK